MSSDNNNKISVGGFLVALGIIYGDIGTSPLYVMKAIVGTELITKDLVYGGVSCVFWTLMLITTFKYVYLALNADNQGEGGIFALYALVRQYKSKWIIYPAIIGCASLIADGFITPPISVSSAIEGLKGLDGFADFPVVGVVLGILVALFAFQQFGTNVIGKAFGPIMVVWFAMIAWAGIASIIQYPSVIEALHPYYALKLVTVYRGELHMQHGFWLLGAVFLCTTGGEAMYSDLGHCGKKNIRGGWLMVFICLMINYLGQAAFLMTHFEGKPFMATSVFYGLIPSDLLPYSIAVATAATIIASQALISGCFTLVNEAMKLNLWPNMKVNYPTQMKGQIYIPTMNWFLLAGCIGVVLLFKDSDHMINAYGLAIILNMLMTTSLLLYYMYMKNYPIWGVVVVGILLVSVESAFMVSNLQKFAHGGWFSALLAVVLFVCIFAWYKAKLLREQHLSFMDFTPIIPMLKDLREDDTIAKEATNLVYMSMSTDKTKIDTNIFYSLFRKRPKRADIYWFVHVDISDSPFGTTYQVETLVDKKVFFIKIKFGFKVEHKVNRMFANIVQKLQDDGDVDELSHYPSLRKHDLPADFKFILLNSRISADDEITPYNQFIIRIYRFLKKLSLATHEDFGLEISNVEIETVPINVSKMKKDFEMIREY